MSLAWSSKIQLRQVSTQQEGGGPSLPGTIIVPQDYFLPLTFMDSRRDFVRI